MNAPYVSDTDFTLHNGDAADVLARLPARSVHMACTSPPFWGLRDYGTGDAGIGLEDTPEEWASALVRVFSELRRVLRDDGTLWVECGDSYAGGSGKMDWAASGTPVRGGGRRKPVAGRKPKDVVGQPWMLAFALRADGWYLRSPIIWHKPNCMPESATDRPTVAHSYVFLLSKQPQYFYDQDAVREPYDSTAVAPAFRRDSAHYLNNAHHPGSASDPDGRSATAKETHASHERSPNPDGRNSRSVWTIPTEKYSGDHYATWPQALVERMILAGTSEHGVCPECGSPWERVTEGGIVSGSMSGQSVRDPLGRGHSGHRTEEGKPQGTMSREGWQARTAKTTTGWAPGCDHDHDPVPAVILDPFMGAGTTALVARRLGRHSVGIELSEPYCAQAATRLQQLSLLTVG